MAGEEVDAVRVIEEVDVEDVVRDFRVVCAVDEERKAGDEMVNIGVRHAVGHGWVVVAERLPALG